jgi:hypothetical protein
MGQTCITSAEVNIFVKICLKNRDGPDQMVEGDF